MEISDYLKRPYGRLVVPEEDGTFRAEIIEFPGCIAIGDTAPEALGMLEEVAASWLEAALDNGQSIPEPMENTDFSGKLVVRLPKSLHKKASYTADREGVSLNQFIVTALATHVGVVETISKVMVQVNPPNIIASAYSFVPAASVLPVMMIQTSGVVQAGIQQLPMGVSGLAPYGVRSGARG
jgi:predicted RNase H-like HicB family nuclease